MYATKKILILLILVIPVIFIIAEVEFPNNVPTLISFLVLFALFIIDIENTINKILHTIFSEKENTLLLINKTNIKFLLKHYSSSNLLKESPLLKLHSVKLTSQKNDLTRVQSLQKLAVNALSRMKDNVITNKRTKSTLKYEIIRTIMEDQASESQILWNLGFKANSVIKSDDIPLFPAVKNSQYKATSRDSYKRLRNEAIDEFKWHIKQQEKKAMRFSL